MGKKITEYTNTRNTFDDGDLFDVSAFLNPGYESQKTTYAIFKANLASAGFLSSGDNVSELTNDAGYLTSFTEVDPVFTASPANNVIDSGGGTLFLADDGTYKSAGTNFATNDLDLTADRLHTTTIYSANLRSTTNNKPLILSKDSNTQGDFISLDFQLKPNGSTYEPMAQIVGGIDPTAPIAQREGYLAFHTANGFGSFTEKMRIDNGGNVTIGSPTLGANKFAVAGDTRIEGGLTGVSPVNNMIDYESSVSTAASFQATYVSGHPLRAAGATQIKAGGNLGVIYGLNNSSTTNYYGIVGDGSFNGLYMRGNTTIFESSSGTRRAGWKGGNNTLQIGDWQNITGTAKLYIHNTDSANLAHIFLEGTGGVNPTTPANGDFWYNGTNLNFYDGTTTHDLLAGGADGNGIYGGNGGNGGDGTIPTTTTATLTDTFTISETGGSVIFGGGLTGNLQTTINKDGLFLNGSGGSGRINITDSNGQSFIEGSLRVGSTSVADAGIELQVDGQTRIASTGVSNTLRLEHNTAQQNALLFKLGSKFYGARFDTNNSLYFDGNVAAGTNQLLTLGNNNNVGIGMTLNTLPSAKLHVNGDTQIDGDLTVNQLTATSVFDRTATGTYLDFTQGGFTYASVESEATGGYLKVNTNAGADRAVFGKASGSYINNNLRVGDTNSSTGSKYEAYWAGSGAFFKGFRGAFNVLELGNFSTGGAIQMYDATGVRFMYLVGNGSRMTNSLRIGTDAPITAGKMLQVDGDTQIDGDLTVDTDTLFVDASLNRVGINKTTLVANLDIVSNGTGVSTQVLRLEDSGNNDVLQVRGNGKTIIGNGLGDGAIQVSSTGGGAAFSGGGAATAVIHTKGSVSGVGIHQEQGTMCIGSSTPSTSTQLDLGASSATKSHINFRSGVAPTTPNDGDMWFDGTNLNIRISGVTRTINVT